MVVCNIPLHASALGLEAIQPGARAGKGILHTQYKGLANSRVKDWERVVVRVDG